MAQRIVGRRGRGGRSGGALPVRLGIACLVLAVAAFVLGALRAQGGGGVEFVRDEGESEIVADASGVEAQRDSDPVSPATANPAPVVVHVDGAVANPGVYELRGVTPRARDAIEAAGGLTEDADTTSLNLAQAVTDGSKVHVPHVGEAVVQVAEPTTGAGSAGAGPVNINTAGADELKTLPGVGDATAASIIREREEHGPFTSPEDIMRVSGIGEKKFEKIRDGICV